MGEYVQVMGNNNRKIASNIVLLLLGRLVSLLGSGIYSFAISLYVLKVTGSGMTFALSLVCGALPGIIFGPIAGVLSDKIDRKRMVVLMDILSGVVLLALSGLAIIDDLRLPYIYLASFLLSTCSTFFSVPFQAAIPNIVDEKNLMKVNSLSQAITSITSIAGPSLGGVIYAFVNIKLFLVINGITFILSGISEMFIDFNLSKAEAKEEVAVTENTNVEEGSFTKSLFNDFIEGFAYLKSVRSMFMMALSSVVLNLFFALGLTVPFPYIVNELLKMSEAQYGVLQSVFPMGALVGAIVLSALPQSKRNWKKIFWGLIIMNLGIITLGVLMIPSLMVFTNNTYFIIFIVLQLILSVAIVFINIPIEVTMQRIIPDNMRGRVFGLVTTFAMSCLPIGYIVSGILIDFIPVWILPVASGILLLIGTGMVSSNKDLREL